jgi:hypothetical protein
MLKQLYRKIVHWLIVQYLKSCWGAFHAFPYGSDGRYVVLMNEDQYHHYTMEVREWYRHAEAG